jgi:hypothetical protein
VAVCATWLLSTLMAAPAIGATYVWSSGSFVAGTTAPDPLAAGDVLSITGSASKSFGAGVAWTNHGEVQWDASSTLSLGTGASVTNHGLWDARAEVNQTLSGGSGTLFFNTGTLRKSMGAATTTTFGGSSLVFDNSGTLEAQVGTLRVDTPGAVFRDGSRFIGAGRVDVTSSAAFAGTLASQNLHLTGGNNRVWTGTGVQIQGRVDWDSGTLAGGWQVGAGQQLVMTAGTSTRALNNATLVNDGSVQWANTGSVGLGGASLLHNRGLFDAQADGSLSVNGSSQLLNEGTLRKSAGAGTSSFAGSAAFTNRGVIDVQTGTLQFASSQNRFEAGGVFQGAGTAFVSTSSTFAGAQQSGNLVLGGGNNRVWTGEDATLSGSTRWRSGSFAGSWQLLAGQTLQVEGSDTAGFTGAASVFTNHGHIAWNSSSDLRLGGGATLVNAGLIELQTNVDVLTPGGGGSFVNQGRLVKMAEGDASLYSVGLGIDNQGVIDVQRGTLRLPNGYFDQGTLTGDGSFAIFNGFTSAGTLAPGSNGIGTLGLTGDDGATLAVGSTLALDLSSVASFDRLVVDQSLWLGGGTLALNCWDDCSFAVGDLLTIITHVGPALTSGFGDMTLSGFATGAFDLQYDDGAVRLLVTQAVTPVPEPGAGALFFAGLAAMGWRLRRRGMERRS